MYISKKFVSKKLKFILFVGVFATMLAALSMLVFTNARAEEATNEPEQEPQQEAVIDEHNEDAEVEKVQKAEQQATDEVNVDEASQLQAPVVEPTANNNIEVPSGQWISADGAINTFNDIETGMAAACDESIDKGQQIEVKLLNDWVADSSTHLYNDESQTDEIEIKRSSQIKLDLNGHTIDKAYTSESTVENDSSIIKPNRDSSLQLIDSATNGKIIHAGAYMISGDGSVTLDSVVISDNCLAPYDPSSSSNDTTQILFYLTEGDLSINNSQITNNGCDFCEIANLGSHDIEISNSHILGNKLCWGFDADNIIIDGGEIANNNYSSYLINYKNPIKISGDIVFSNNYSSAYNCYGDVVFKRGKKLKISIPEGKELGDNVKIGLLDYDESDIEIGQSIVLSTDSSLTSKNFYSALGKNILYDEDNQLKLKSRLLQQPSRSDEFKFDINTDGMNMNYQWKKGAKADILVEDTTEGVSTEFAGFSFGSVYNGSGSWTSGNAAGGYHMFFRISDTKNGETFSLKSPQGDYRFALFKGDSNKDEIVLTKDQATGIYSANLDDSGYYILEVRTLEKEQPSAPVTITDATWGNRSSIGESLPGQTDASILNDGNLVPGTYCCEATGTPTQVANSVAGSLYMVSSFVELTQEDIDGLKKKEHTITFDAAGGVCETTTSQTSNFVLSSLPTATRDGYVFDGWFLPDGTTKVEASVTKFVVDTTVTAHWTENGGDNPGPGPTPGSGDEDTGSNISATGSGSTGDFNLYVIFGILALLAASSTSLIIRNRATK